MTYKYIVAVGIGYFFLFHSLRNMFIYDFNWNLYTVIICDVRIRDSVFRIGSNVSFEHPVGSVAGPQNIPDIITPKLYQTGAHPNFISGEGNRSYYRGIQWLFPFTFPNTPFIEKYINTKMYYSKGKSRNLEENGAKEGMLYDPPF